MTVKSRLITVLACAALIRPCTAEDTTGYANSNGLKMYYEIHGTGDPLLLLHGAFGTAEGWSGVLPTLCKSRRVILLELQGHGRTADIDRPLSFGAMAEDAAALLRQLKVVRTDVVGYSMGGDVAFALAIKHPELVRKLAILGAGTGATQKTYDPAAYKQFKSMTPDNFNFPQVKDPYVRFAPDPAKWPLLVSKVISMDDKFAGFPDKEVRSIKAQTLLMLGDHDVVRVDHGEEVRRLIPNCRLAVIRDSDHFVLFTNPQKVLAVLVPFLNESTTHAGASEAAQ